MIPNDSLIFVLTRWTSPKKMDYSYIVYKNLRKIMSHFSSRNMKKGGKGSWKNPFTKKRGYSLNSVENMY